MRKLLYLLPIALIGCNAEKRFNDYSIRNPDKFKQLAAVLAPCIEVNIKPDTIFKTRVDTLITAGNTVIERRNDTVFVTKQLPGKTIVKHDVQTVTKTVVDSRAVDAANLRTVTEREKVIKITQQLEDTKSTKKTWMWIAIGCMAVIVGYGAIKIYGMFTGVGKLL